MKQVHKRFIAEQVKALLKGYCQGNLDRANVEEILEINKTRFFELLEQYRRNPDKFSINYERPTSSKLPDLAEKRIKEELMLDKGLIEDPDLPVKNYNYSAIKDHLIKEGIMVSLPSIIRRAKALNCYRLHPKQKAHDRHPADRAE